MTDDHDLIRQLRHSALARDLDDAALARLAEAGRVQRTTDGEVLLEEDRPGERLVVVLEGEVEVVKRDADEEWFEICRLGAGSVLGEVSLILERPATARVRTLVPCRIFALDRVAFQEMVSAGSDSALALALALARLLAARLQRTNERAVELARAEREDEGPRRDPAKPPADSLMAFRNKLLSEWNF